MALAEGISQSLMLRDEGYELLGSSFCMSLVPTAGIIRNVTLVGSFGFSRRRRVKIQAQPIWKKNESAGSAVHHLCTKRNSLSDVYILWPGT